MNEYIPTTNHKAPKNQIWLFKYAIDYDFKLKFNKKLLYCRENVQANVYKAKTNLARAATCTQCMHDVYIHNNWI